MALIMDNMKKAKTPEKKKRPIQSSIIYQDFPKYDSLHSQVFFYKLVGVSLYGIFSPISFQPPNPTLFEYVDTISMETNLIELLKLYQDLFWRSVTLTRNGPSDKKSKVNMLVVPLTDGCPDYSIVQRSLSSDHIDIDMSNIAESLYSVSYTHLTLPTNREV